MLHAFACDVFRHHCSLTPLQLLEATYHPTFKQGVRQTEVAQLEGVVQEALEELGLKGRVQVAFCGAQGREEPKSPEVVLLLAPIDSR